MRRAPRSAFCDGERVVFTDVCRRASRRLRVVGWAKMSTTQLYTGYAASLRAPGWLSALQRRRCFWLVPLTLQSEVFDLIVSSRIRLRRVLARARDNRQIKPVRILLALSIRASEGIIAQQTPRGRIRDVDRSPRID